MNTREFHFTEGTSSKFWKITVDGVKQTVHYGRIGATGQTQTKEFDSDAAANAASEKLIAEKVKKGYAEVGASDGLTLSCGSELPPPTSQEVSDGVESGLETPNEISGTPGYSPAPEEPDQGPLVERSLDLSEVDYINAGVRPRAAKPKPEPPPFDFQDAVRRFRKALHSHIGWIYPQAEVAPVLSKEEAHFWAATMVRAHGYESHDEVIKELETMEFTGNIPASELYFQHKYPSHNRRWTSVQLASIIAAVCPIDEFVTILADPSAEPYDDLCRTVLEGFERFVLPYLTESELDVLRQKCRQVMTGSRPFTDMMLAFAAIVGAADAVEQQVARWPTRSAPIVSGWSTGYKLDILLGIRNKQRILEQAFRTKTFPNNPSEARRWLVATEYEGLEGLADAVIEFVEKEFAENLARVFALVHAPEAARPVLRMYHESKAPGVAREWFKANLDHAIVGLARIAVAKDPYSAKAASMLWNFARNGQDRQVSAHIESHSDPIRSKLRDLVLPQSPDALDTSTTPSELKAVPIPLLRVRATDQAPGDFHPITVKTPTGPRRLSDPQVVGLLSALRRQDEGPSRDYIAAVKADADPASLDTFAWALFDGWIGDDAPPKEKWKMLAMGHLGGDATALTLSSLIRKWPVRNEFARAVLGLECLKTMGTDTALMLVNGIMNDVSLKAIRQRAAATLDSVAAARGLSREQLEDRIVPDCGLDTRGTRVFDFGPRQFRVVLGPQMTAMIKDSAGKVSTDLPKPNAKDDRALAEASVSEWKLLKKQVTQIAKTQVARLEKAMVTGRRWPPVEFDRLLVHHPLMTNPVRRLLWGAFDGNNQLKSSFRVTEDQSLADSSDSTCALPNGSLIGIVHPLDLAASDMATWGEIWSDYELVPPFPQLGRRTMRISPDEADVVELTRFATVAVNSDALIHTLDRLGWKRSAPLDAGCIHEHTKPFERANATAVVWYNPGAPITYLGVLGDQTISQCNWLPGIHVKEDTMYPAHASRLKWGEVDPVAVSEVLADITSIVEKEA